MDLPPPKIIKQGELLIVRDDLLPGGTKRRILPLILKPNTEYVYASPAYGYAQIALAHACRDIGSTATIFTAKRNIPHNRTIEARAAGARIITVPLGYLSNVQAKARYYCEMNNATLLPFGFDTREFADGFVKLARGMDIAPREVWSVAGSGTLSRAVQKAWPDADVYAVRIGKEAKVGKATIIVAPEKFEQDAKQPPPFPSCSNYDAKAWQFVEEHAAPGALFWNVAA